MKQLVNSAIAAAALSFSFNAHMAHASTVAGMGIQSCGTWTVDRKANSEASIADESWIMGFLSGAGTIVPQYDPLNGTDADGVWAWIDNYCAAHPLDDMYLAAEAFVKFHPK